MSACFSARRTVSSERRSPVRGQVIGQTRQSPEGERPSHTPGPSASAGEQHGPIRLGHLGGAAKAWRIVPAVEALGSVALEPASHRGLALPDNGRDLRYLEPLCRREQDHVGACPQPRILGGAIELSEFLVLYGG
jgi:hypothetical protein